MADLESGWNQVHTFHAIHKGLGRFSRKADSSRAFLSDHRLNLTKSCTLKPVNHTADEMRFPLVLHHNLSAHILAAGSLVAVWCMGAAGMLCCFCRGSFDQSEHATRWATSICVINIMCVFIYTYIHIHIRQYCVYLRPHHRSQSWHMSSLLSALYIEVSYDCHLLQIQNLKRHWIVWQEHSTVSCAESFVLPQNHYSTFLVSSCSLPGILHLPWWPWHWMETYGFWDRSTFTKKTFWRVEVGCQVL